MSSKGKILVVDDEEDMVALLRRTLAEQGLDVQTAMDGDEAIELVRAQDFDLVTLDMRMPGKDGLDVLRVIKTEKPDTWAIMLSVVTDTQQAAEAVRLGAYTYITKPFDLDKLKITVRNAVEARQATVEARQAAVENKALLRDLTDLILDMVRTLVSVIEARDPYTERHSERVMTHSLAVADEMRLSPDFKRVLRLCALLHDVGKVGVSDDILHKDGPLSPHEWEEMRKHSGQGVTMLELLTRLEHVFPGIRHHHEKWDGTGYPDGLCGDDIPFLARIIAVTDAWDAMMSRRPHRGPLGRAKARAEIEKNLGRQFDPVVGRAFLNALDKGDIV